MKKSLFVTALVAVLGLASVASAEVTGTYNLDKAPLIKQMQERMDKVPAKSRAFAMMAMQMIKTMKMQLVLANDGTAKMSAKMNLFGRQRVRLSLGQWKKEGGVVTVTVTDKRKGKRKPRNSTLICNVQGKRLGCQNKGRRSKETMFFDRVGAAPATALAPKAATTAPAKAAPAKAATTAPAKAAPATRPTKTAPSTRPANR